MYNYVIIVVRKYKGRVCMEINSFSKRQEGFTLIELLAVIIILGVLLIIAIPAVTKYIDDSRKDSYITTAKELISGAKNLVNSGKLDIYDTDTTYYIPSSCIPTESGGKSPYGEFDKAYIAVTYTQTGYNYFWISRDTSGIGIKFLTPYNELDKDLILSSIEKGDITPSVGVGGRSKIEVVKESDCKSMEEAELSERVTENGERLVVVYPEGKSKEDLVLGDEVKILNEEFYVLGYNSSKDELRLFAKYNLNVGDSTVPGGKVGIQNSHALGASGDYRYGKVKFANTTYWEGQVGSGKKYPGNYGFNANGTNVANVYDSNCIPYKYVQAYVKYFEDNRVHIKSSGLIGQEEAYQLIINGYSTIVNTSGYWTNSPSLNKDWMMTVEYVENLPITSFDPLHQYGLMQSDRGASPHGVRPIIII